MICCMTQLFYLKLVNTLLQLGESWDPGVDALARISNWC